MYECKLLWRRGLRVGPCLAWARPLLRASPLGEGEQQRPSLEIRTWLLLLLRVSRCVPPSCFPTQPSPLGRPARPARLAPSPLRVPWGQRSPQGGRRPSAQASRPRRSRFRSAQNRNAVSAEIPLLECVAVEVRENVKEVIHSLLVFHILLLF